MTAQPQAAAALPDSGKRSHGQILKSSALIGGASILNIGIGIVRTKVLALLLGPAGIGLFGMLISIYELARSVAVMGLNSSGVREIADANGSGDSHRIGRAVTTLRRVAIFFAVVGAVLLAVLCVPVARFSFGDGLMQQTIPLHRAVRLQAALQSVTAAYTWRFNGQLLAGQTTGSLLLANPEAADSGVYTVEVSAMGKTVSNHINLKVTPSRPASHSSASPLVIKLWNAPGPFSVALLGLAVLLGAVSAGQIALIQGMRRIADLARANVLGALLGTVLALAAVYYFVQTGDGYRGVAPALVCVSAMTLLASWWYSRKVPVQSVVLKWKEVAQGASSLLKLGFVFMASGLMTLGAAWLIRIIVLRKLGEDAAGHYQAAWVLGGLYIGIIVQAMGADFFPRLSAAARNNAECNRLVNEQAEVGLLLAGAGVVGSLTFAPLVIDLFYSTEFGPAVEILRWICLGMLLRVASWPLGYVLVAKGEGKIFFWTEFASNVAQLLLVWGGVRWFGLAGTGIAFFGLYMFYTIGIYFVVRRLSGFRWSAANRQLALLFMPLVAVVFISWYFLPALSLTVWNYTVPRIPATILGLLITVALGLYSIRAFCTLIPPERLPQGVQKALRWFRLSPSDTPRNL